MNAGQQTMEKNIRLQDTQRSAAFQIAVDGLMVEAFPGETVAAVLLACGKTVFSHAADGSPRGYACGIGRCFGCLVTIDGIENVRACQTYARPGMEIVTAQSEERSE